jgi:zinc protease
MSVSILLVCLFPEEIIGLVIHERFVADDTRLFPYNYAIDDFDSGLRLVTVPTDFPHMVALYIVVQAGSRNEVEPGKNGYAHPLEHIMWRTTRRNSAI